MLSKRSNLIRVALILLTCASLEARAEFDKRHYSAHPEEYLQIAPSSILGASGNGVYVKRKLPQGLTALPKNLTLPFSYPGSRVSAVRYHDELLEDLVRLTNEYDRDRNLPIDHPRIQKELQYLKDAYDITVKIVGDSKYVDWDNLHDRFVGYPFHIETRDGQAQVLYLNSFLSNGEPNIANELKNMAFLVNEPPPYDFVNLLTLTPQLSSVSLFARVTRDDQLVYVTEKEVPAGSELFISYGPTYEANRQKLGYKVNMDRINGCGSFSIVGSYFRKLKEKAYLKTKNVEQFLLESEKDHIGFFRAISNYVHDQNIQMDLDSAKFAWFRDYFGPEYTWNHRQAAERLKQPEPVASEPLNKRGRVSSPTNSHEVIDVDCETERTSAFNSLSNSKVSELQEYWSKVIHERLSELYNEALGKKNSGT